MVSQFQEANQLQRSGKLEEAVIAYRNAIAQNPDFYWSYHNLGETLTQLGRLDEAVEAYQKAVELNPSAACSHLSLAGVLEKQGKEEEAIASYRQAVQLNPQLTQSHDHLSKLFSPHNSQQQKVVEAQNHTIEQQIVKDVESDPWMALHHRAEQLHASGDLDEAIIAYQNAIDMNPSYFKSYHNLGEVLQLQGDLDKAIEYYECSLDLNPSFKLSKFQLERAIAQKNKFHSLLYILDTHKNDLSGLGVIARHCSHLGELIGDTTQVKGKVLVPGRPDYYSSLVNVDNVNYILTMFESNRIPQEWVNIINEKFTEVFVPHSWVKSAFQKSGVTRPIFIVPLAYQKRNRVKPLQKSTTQFKLGYLCGPTKRKNVEKLIEAVEQLNREGNSIELMIHCNWLKPEQKVWKQYSFVNLTEGKCYDNIINQWYSQLDAYICPSSGEGWSLTPRESMSLGIPTIISDIPVHDELLKSGFYLPIKSDDWEPAYYEFLQDYCGQWKSYSIQQIKSAIIAMIENYDYWYDVAQTGQHWVFSKYKWKLY
jgi:tetratricopeptide (TPR) repeat protein